MEENKFIGRKYNNEELEDIQESLNEWSMESLRLIDGELPKSEEEIKIIETANTLIAEELRSIGVSDYDPPELERVHILSPEVFESAFPNCTSGGFYDSVSDVVLVNKAQASLPKIISLTVHELLHRASKRRLHHNREDDGISDARTGYRIHSKWKDGGRTYRLRGFNEMIVDFSVCKIFEKNKQYLGDVHSITEKDINGPIYSYTYYGPLLDAIISGISNNKGLPKGKVFEDFEKGQFQDNILVLKDIERAFGPGSLEVVSLLGELEGDQGKKLDDMIRIYFCEMDESSRNIQRQEINNFYTTSMHSKNHQI